MNTTSTETRDLLLIPSKHTGLAKHLNKLGDTVTTRNWNTMNKLAALAKAMQA